MSTTAVRSPAEFEEQIQRYLYERSEEGRAVRVGEKEISEQAAIVARYADLFSRDQLSALRELAARLELSPRKAFQPIRIAVTGSKVSPGLFESLELLGKEESLRRLSAVAGPGAV